MSQQAGQRNGEPATSGRPRDLMRKIRRRQAAGAAYYSAARPPIGKPDYMRPCRRDSVKPGYFAAKRTKFVCLQIFCGGANGIHSLHSIYTRGFPFLFDALPEKGKKDEGKPESGYIFFIILSEATLMCRGFHIFVIRKTCAVPCC